VVNSGRSTRPAAPRGSLGFELAHGASGSAMPRARCARPYAAGVSRSKENRASAADANRRQQFDLLRSRIASGALSAAPRTVSCAIERVLAALGGESTWRARVPLRPSAPHVRPAGRRPSTGVDQRAARRAARNRNVTSFMFASMTLVPGSRQQRSGCGHCPMPATPPSAEETRWSRKSAASSPAHDRDSKSISVRRHCGQRQGNGVDAGR
jgi:hypothetical protein